MRTNIDYGPAVLPAGEVLEFKNASFPTVTIEKDAARFVKILSNSMDSLQEHCRLESDVQNLASSKGIFNAAKLNKYLEQIYCKIRQDCQLEVNTKVPPEILPETWMNIRTTKDGLHIELKSTSDETRRWLQSITMRLSAHLKARLNCLVDITVSDRQGLAYQMNQDKLSKDARHP